MQWSLNALQCLAQVDECCIIAVIAIDILKPGRELDEGLWVEVVVLFETRTCARLKLLETPSGSADTDDRHIETAAPSQRLQCRKYFLEGQIAGGTEENKCV